MWSTTHDPISLSCSSIDCCCHKWEEIGNRNEFSSSEHNQSLYSGNPWLATTSSLPSSRDQPKFLPTLGKFQSGSIWVHTNHTNRNGGNKWEIPFEGNGHLALTATQPTIRKSCLYSGRGWTTHRARWFGNHSNWFWFSCSNNFT